MFRKFEKFLFIFTFFFNCFNIYLAKGPTIKEIVCNHNPKVCQQYVFDTIVEKDSLKMLTMNCYFAEPINTISLKFTLLSKNSGKFSKLVENTVDMCQTLNKTSDIPFAVKFRKQISKYGVNIDKCPFQGNVSLEKVPVAQMAIFPFFIPHGEYRMIAFLKDTTRNEAILETTTDIVY